MASQWHIVPFPDIAKTMTNKLKLFVLKFAEELKLSVVKFDEEPRLDGDGWQEVPNPR